MGNSIEDFIKIAGALKVLDVKDQIKFKDLERETFEKN